MFMSIQAIREDILSLRGANVKIFGQQTTLRDDVARDTIDILDVLAQLEDSEIKLSIELYDEEAEDHVTKEFHSVEDMVNHMEDIGQWVEVSHDNSYNWSSPVSNDFDFRTYEDKETGSYYIQLMVHRYGDVRGNYTEYALLEYDHRDGFIQDVAEANKSIEVGDYYIDISVFSDGMEVYNRDGIYVKTIHDLEEFEKQVEEGDDI